MERPLRICGSLVKQMLLLLGGLAFIVVGVMMLILLPSASSLSGWATPIGSIMQIAIGFLALLFGGAVVVVLAVVASRPILLLYSDHLTDARRKLDIPFSEIRAVSVRRTRGLTAVQWLLFEMREPEKYAKFEHLSKRTGLTDADLTLDLSLASAADFERAIGFVQTRLNQGDIQGRMS